MNTKISRVFVSYSHKDQNWAKELFNASVATTRGIALQSIDYRLLEPGDDFDEKLQREIQDSAGFVLLVSKSFLASEYVQKKEWKWIQSSVAGRRVCCIEIGKALSGPGAPGDNDLILGLKTIHRDLWARLPQHLRSSDLDRHIDSVRRSIARMLDPEGTKVVERLEKRKFKNIEWLSDGRVANIYTAQTPTFGRKLAVKVPRPEASAEFVAGVMRAEQISTIPNFARVYEVDIDNEPFYSVTEFIEGQTLDAKLKALAQDNKSFPLHLAHYVLFKLSQALKSVHDRQMSHLNVRPTNILIGPFNEPYLLPTGRARPAGDGRTDFTSDRAQLEDLMYMLPERIRGKDWKDESADIYSLGVIGYWMIAGSPPEMIENRDQLASGSETMPVFVKPADLLSKRPDCSVSLAHTVTRMLATQPAYRYRTFDDVLAGLMRNPDEKLALVELSWRRCLDSELDIFTKFYGRFFQRAGPAAEEQFAKPWPTQRQKNLLRDAVINLIQYYDLHRSYREVPLALNPLEGLAVQHASRKIQAAHFQTFVSALVDTVLEVELEVNPNLQEGDRIRQAWKTVVDPGADYLERRVTALAESSATPISTKAAHQ